jgi:transcriptional regulator with XRE-family HTH domain
MTTSDPRWLELLRAEADLTSRAAVADRIGYSRTTISLVLSGKYPGNTDKIAAKALAGLEPVLTVACPYLGVEIEAAACNQHSGQRAPTHNPAKMNHWKACHQCPKRKGA